MAKNTARAGQASAPREKPASGKKGAAAHGAAPTHPKRGGGVPTEIGVKVLGEFLDLTERRIQQLVNEGVLPRSGHGTYPFKKAVAAFYGAKLEAEKAHTESSADRLRDERAREIQVKTAVRERELIPLPEAVEHVEGMVGDLLTSISGLPARLTRNPRERQRFEAICDEERLRLSDRFGKRGKALEAGAAVAEAEHEDDA